MTPEELKEMRAKLLLADALTTKIKNLAEGLKQKEDTGVLTFHFGDRFQILHGKVNQNAFNVCWSELLKDDQQEIKDALFDVLERRLERYRKELEEL